MPPWGAKCVRMQRKKRRRKERDEKKERMREDAEGTVSECVRGVREKEGGREKPSKKQTVFFGTCWLLIVQSLWCLCDLAHARMVHVYTVTERDAEVHPFTCTPTHPNTRSHVYTCATHMKIYVYIYIYIIYGKLSRLM
jgi:hypothetical protein